MFLFFYYTDVYGISAAAIGTIMLVARVWVAVSDPLIDIIADRTNTRWGKFRPYMMKVQLLHQKLCCRIAGVAKPVDGFI